MRKLQSKVLLFLSKFVLFFLFINCLTYAKAQQNTKEIVGRVKNGDAPLEFVSVIEKGSNNGTFTAADGSFSLTVSNVNATLLFSSIGFKSIEIKALEAQLINMETEANMLDEVVSVGYSSKSKAELSSSVTILKSEQLTDVTTSDMGNMLQGKAAGVYVTNASGQPGSKAEIRIRGTGSITAQSDPLYVVDGIIGGDFNPNDVASITILKDAGATALYGSAASGGVIVVTTKQPLSKQATQVNFMGTFGLKNTNNGRQQMMNGRELYKAHREMMSPDLFETQRPNILAKRDFNWVDAAFKQGIMQDYYLSVSGKGDKVGYYISANYYDEEGTLINTGYKKLNTRGNFNIQLSDQLKLNTRLTVSNSQTDSYEYTTLEDGYKNLPWDYPYDYTGTFIKIDSDKRPDGNKWYSQDKRNFLHSEQYNSEIDRSNQMTADIQLIYTINSWLIAESSNRAGFGQGKFTQLIDPRSYNVRYNNGYIEVVSTDQNSFSSTNLLKATKTWNVHNVSGFFGTEYGQSAYHTITTAGTNIPVGIAAPSASTPLPHGSSSMPTKGLSFLGQVQYSFQNKLFATFSLRTDGSSQFGPEKRWGTFPAASASWLISNEQFLKNSSIVSFMKLRSSYGVTGNSNIPPFQFLSNYIFNAQYNNSVGAIPLNLANPRLGWESAYMTSFGLDLGLFKRIDLNVDWYNIENKDLLLNVPMSPTNGFEHQLQNIGSVRNQGLEIQIATQNLLGTFKWETNFNIAFNSNKVTFLPGNKSFTQQSVGGINQKVDIGKDIYTWYMPKWIGVDPNNGDPLWEKTNRDTNGQIVGTESTNVYTEAGYQEVGKATPTFTGGLVNTFSYKGIGLSVNCNFVVGNKIYNSMREMFDADGAYLGYNMMRLQDDWNRWTTPGQNATHPKLTMHGNKQSNKTSSRYLEDGTFFRVKNVRLSYALPQIWVNKLSIRQAKVFASVDNVLTLTKFSGMDPEVSLKSGMYSLAGLYSFQYPVSRQFLFGIELNF